MSQQQPSQAKTLTPATLTQPKQCASQYNNSYSMARAHIISNHWLRANNLTTIEKGILRIIAEYCKSIEFRWDNYNPSTVTVDKEGLTLSTSTETPASSTQMISSNTGFSRGIHIFKIKQTTFSDYCRRDIGISTTKDVLGMKSWRGLRTTGLL